MAQTSKIEWTDVTWNPVAGCTIASPGCSNCYAMQVPPSEKREFAAFLRRLGYHCVEETSNPAYRMFLGR